VLHTDEGLLHGYLDGALKTDQRLEVESHVAACGPCAAALQEARQLKSQATKILSRAAPPPLARPPRSMPDRRRKRPMIPVAWAASVAVALAAGWTARTMMRQAPASQPLSVESSGGTPGLVGGAAVQDSMAAGEARTDELGWATKPQEPARAEAEAPAPAEGRRPAAAPSRRQRSTTNQSPRPTAPPRAEPEMAKAAAPPPAALADRVVEQQAREQAAVTGAVRRDAPVNEARAEAVPRSAAVRPVYAVPLVEALPGYAVVAVATGEHPLLVVSQLSAAGDSVILVYDTMDGPADPGRIFDQGIVLERDANGQPVTIVGRYRTVGTYRITARSTGGISRDSLATLLDLLELRDLR